MAEVGNIMVRVDAVITDEHYRVAMGAVMAANECMDLLVAENVKLRDENSRLRKYISKALSTISYCDCCLYVDYECDTETMPMHEGCKAFEELRKLGVKVD